GDLQKRRKAAAVVDGAMKHLSVAALTGRAEVIPVCAVDHHLIRVLASLDHRHQVVGAAVDYGASQDERGCGLERYGREAALRGLRGQAVEVEAGRAEQTLRRSAREPARDREPRAGRGARGQALERAPVAVP